MMALSSKAHCSFGRTWPVDLKLKTCSRCMNLPGGLSMRRGSSERKKECNRFTREEKAHRQHSLMYSPDFCE